MVELEVLLFARNPADHRRLKRYLREQCVWLETSDDTLSAAVDLQETMLTAGMHRKPIPDLIIASVAQHHEAVGFRDGLAVVIRLSAVGMEQVDLEIGKPPVAIAATCERSIVFAARLDIAGLEPGVELRDLGDHDGAVLDVDNVDLGAHRWFQVVGAGPGQRVTNAHRVEAGDSGEAGILVQAEENGAATVVAEGADRVPDRTWAARPRRPWLRCREGRLLGSVTALRPY